MNNTHNASTTDSTDACRATSEYQNYRYYDFRLTSFASWPKQMEPDKYALAKCGFVYTGKSDKVTCFDCGLCLEMWERADDPFREHFKWSPTCDYLNMIGIPDMPGMSQGRDYPDRTREASGFKDWNTTKSATQHPTNSNLFFRK
jgi:hypothetical protein